VAIVSNSSTNTNAKYDTFQYLVITYARAYAIYLGSYNTYEQNYFEYTGGNALDLNANALSEGDYFLQNHDEFTFGNSGGQVWLDGLDALGADSITITDATIDGQDQHSTVGSAAGSFSCIVPTPPGGSIGTAVGNLGIEARGSSNASLINNSIYNNRYQNVLFGSGTGGTTAISTYSSYCPSCSAQTIQANYVLDNIDFQDAVSGTIKFDGVMSTYSVGYGIDLEGTFSSPTITFQHSGGAGTVCLTGNTSGRLANPHGLTLTGFPGSDTCPTH
jgi:hypothetical protein